MKAAVIEHYGKSDVFNITDVPMPVPADTEVIIKLAASSVNPIDWKLRSGALRIVMPLKFPCILGYDFAGVITQIGKQVHDFKVGDQVYGLSNVKARGTYAEYIALDQSIISLKPDNLTMPEAAAVPLAALTALQSLRNLGKLQAGQSVLIIGAAGGVGCFAVQIAKALGAKVSAVCSTRNIEFVKSLKADDVIDYQQTAIFSNQKQYDVIFDAVATQSYAAVKPFLTNAGIYVTTVPNVNILLSFVVSLFTKQKARCIMMKPNQKDLVWVREQIQQGNIKSIIDSVFPLQDIAKAHAHSESQRARGKIVISMDV